MMMQEPDAGQFNGLDPRQISGVSTGEGSGYNFSFDIVHEGGISFQVSPVVPNGEEGNHAVNVSQLDGETDRAKDAEAAITETVTQNELDRDDSIKDAKEAADLAIDVAKGLVDTKQAEQDAALVEEATTARAAEKANSDAIDAILASSALSADTFVEVMNILGSIDAENDADLLAFTTLYASEKLEIAGFNLDARNTMKDELDKSIEDLDSTVTQNELDRDDSIKDAKEAADLAIDVAKAIVDAKQAEQDKATEELDSKVDENEANRDASIEAAKEAADLAIDVAKGLVDTKQAEQDAALLEEATTARAAEEANATSITELDNKVDGIEDELTSSIQSNFEAVVQDTDFEFTSTSIAGKMAGEIVSMLVPGEVKRKMILGFQGGLYDSNLSVSYDGETTTVSTTLWSDHGEGATWDVHSISSFSAE